MKLINNAGRALGVPGARASLVIGRGQSAEITSHDLKAIKANRVANSWLESGALIVQDVNPTDPVNESEFDPAAYTPPVQNVVPMASKTANDTAIVKHVGRGRYNAFVNDEPLSDEPLDKAEAEKMADEYNASGN